MNNLWVAFLGAGGLAGLFSLGYTIYKDRKSRDIETAKAEGEIKIDSVTEKRIVAEAAQISTDAAIAQQTWWMQQVNEMRKALTKAEKSNKQLRRWAEKHQLWDETAWILAVQSDPEYPPPPKLEEQ